MADNQQTLQALSQRSSIMARNQDRNTRKQRPEVRRLFNFNQTRNKRKMRKVESNGISTSCIVLTLLGLAIVASLGVFVCFIVSPSETQDTNESQHRTIQNNRHNQTVQDHSSPADGMATIKTVLIVFSTATMSLTIAIFIICIFIQRSKKGRPIKQTDRSSLTKKELKKSLANVEDKIIEDNQRENEDNDETSYKEPLMPQKFPRNVPDIVKRNLYCGKIIQFDVCNERKEIVDESTSENEVQKNMSESSNTKPFSQFTNLNEGLKCSDKNIHLKENEVDQIKLLEMVKNENDIKQDDTEAFLDDTTKSSTLFKVNSQNRTNSDAVNDNTKFFNNNNEPTESEKCLIDKDHGDHLTVSQKEDLTHENPQKENVCHVKATNQIPDKENTSSLTYFECKGETEITENSNTLGTTDQPKVEQDEGMHERLNWDKVFVFLAGIMPPSDSTIFFIHLYDSVHDLRGGSIDSIIKRVDCDAKGLETQSRLLRHFQKWKELLGKRASVGHIKDALKQMDYGETLHQLEDFMRQPPLLPQQRNDESLHSSEKCTDAVTSKDVLVKESRTTIGVFELHKNGSKTILCQTQDKQCTGASLTDFKKPSDAVRQAVSAFKTLTRKRLRSVTESSSEQDYECNPSKSRRLKPRPRRILKKSTHTKRKRPNKCDKLVEKDSISHSFVLDLIKTLISSGNAANKISYHLFMRHIVKIIMKKSRMSEEQVLSLLRDDVARCEKKKSSRGHGHEAFIIEFEHGFLMLNREEWDCLELYKGQREKVCARLLSENSDYIDSKYVFINYDGHPLIEQADQEKTTDECCSQSENSSETTETSAEHSDEICEQASVNSESFETSETPTEHGDEICEHTSVNTEQFETSETSTGNGGEICEQASENNEPVGTLETSSEDSEEKYDRKKMPTRQSSSKCMKYVSEVKKQLADKHIGESKKSKETMNNGILQEEVDPHLKRSYINESLDNAPRKTKSSKGNDLKIMDISLD